MENAENVPYSFGAAGKLILAWDAPNIDMALGELLGEKPNPAQRPNWTVLARWLKEQAKSLGASEWEAVIFTNIAPGQEAAVRPWIFHLRKAGFGVFVKPKIGSSDIDDDIVEWIANRVGACEVKAIMLASGDHRAFHRLLETYQDNGHKVALLGFEEFSGTISTIPCIDLGDIPNLLPDTLERTRLNHLPEEGMLLAPLSRPQNSITPPDLAATRAALVGVDTESITDDLIRLVDEEFATLEIGADSILFSNLWEHFLARYPQVKEQAPDIKATALFAFLMEDSDYQLVFDTENFRNLIVRLTTPAP